MRLYRLELGAWHVARAQRLILIADCCGVESNRTAFEANATRTHRVLDEGDLEWGACITTCVMDASQGRTTRKKCIEDCG